MTFMNGGRIAAKALLQPCLTKSNKNQINQVHVNSCIKYQYLPSVAQSVHKNELENYMQ